MKFIYAFDAESKQWFIDNGFVKIGSSKVNGKDVDIFENKRNVVIPANYKKSDVMWSNKLVF